jgi:4-amino-4-deoxy-L-arabinose transferase-like glycosyltransferase
MLDSDPKLSWDGFFKQMKYGEMTPPPFFYLIDRYFMFFFGYNEWNARALGGIVSILAIFFSGKK